MVDGRSASGLPLDGRGTVVTVGTFDGVHRGHWEVLKEIGARARATDRRAVLVTFHPHPLRIVRPEFAPALLTTPDEKKEILAESGLDYVVFLRFTKKLSKYSPSRFVEQILVRHMGVQELVVGYDHGFGRGRSGDADTLRSLGARLGFAVDVVSPVPMGEAPVSSTRIREAVEAGEMGAAREGLGRPYSLRGVVVRGDGRGRTIGFPTANLQIGYGDKLLPGPGIYAVRALLRRGSFGGALHLGPRPTFQGSTPSIELHLLDFDPGTDLYGAEVRVDLLERIRDVRAFGSVEELTERIREDVRLARGILSRDGGGT